MFEDQTDLVINAARCFDSVIIKLGHMGIVKLSRNEKVELEKAELEKVAESWKQGCVRKLESPFS